MIDLGALSIEKAKKHLIDGDFSARELAAAYLDTVAKKNPDINAYVEVYDDVLQSADEAQKHIQDHPLAGIPIAIKDNILVKGRSVSAASRILDGYTATYDATVIQKLKDAHTVFLGRTNMDEFAMGGSTETSAHGITKNPVDMSRVPGGSSGGAAAAITMDGALVALGSDTGGSIRQPAAFCGCVGFKPTYGSVSRHGLIAMGSSLDVIGPLTKTVRDAEIVFDAIRGRDPFDSTTHASDTYAKKEKDTYVIGLPKEAFKVDGLDPEVKKNLEQSIQSFREKGYEVRDISIPTLPLALPVYYILMPAEASTNLSRFDGMKYGLHVPGKDLLEEYVNTRSSGFGDEVRRRIMLGTYVLSSGYYDAFYRKALALQQVIREDCAQAFSDVDMILTPTAPTPAFRIGEKSNNPVSMYLSDIFTVTANIAGLPAISLPSGHTASSGIPLPLGIQLIAAEGQDGVLFKAGKDFLNE